MTRISICQAAELYVQACRDSVVPWPEYQSKRDQAETILRCAILHGEWWIEDEEFVPETQETS